MFVSSVIETVDEKISSININIEQTALELKIAEIYKKGKFDDFSNERLINVMNATFGIHFVQAEILDKMPKSSDLELLELKKKN